jgi:hypothetical protein
MLIAGRLVFVSGLSGEFHGADGTLNVALPDEA